MFERLLIGDIIYFMFLFGAIFFVLWYTPKAIGEWKGYLKKKFQLEQDRILLEIRTPREITKTPMAMELVINALSEPAGGDWWTNITTGKDRPFHSLEMVSKGGEVHFYIWGQRNYKARIESNFYAQYPEVELIEVPDYSKNYPFSLETHKIFGFEYGLTGDDPIPIPTYKIVGFDRGGLKPEEQIDPITQTIESLASIGPNEQMWVQIVFRTHTGNKIEKISFERRFAAFFKMFIPGETKKMVENFWLFWNGKKTYDWKKEGQAIIKKIREGYAKDESGLKELSKSDKLLIEAISENLLKQPFDVGIRTLYIAPKDYYDPENNVHLMGSIFKQYASGDVYNALKPVLITSMTYPWQDRSGKEMKKIKSDLMKHYRRRSFLVDDTEFYKYGKKALRTFVMSSEELATIYHLPGQVAQTPTFERIESTTGKAPSNLPI